MEVKTFLERANKSISSRFQDRLSSVTNSIIEKDNFVIDIHCHFFDIRTINIKYFVLRFIKDVMGIRDDEIILRTNDPSISYLNVSYDTIDNNKLFNSAFDSDENWANFINELEYIESNKIRFQTDKRNLTRGVLDILKNKELLKLKDHQEVYNYYLKNYSLNNITLNELVNKDLITTALMMDLEIGWGVNVRKPLYIQIEELKYLSKDNPILPFFCVDPRRAQIEGQTNLYNLFLYAFSKNVNSFYGIKIYPGLGFLPSDYRLLPIYEICEKKGIPIIAHCGGESVSTSQLTVNAFRFNDEAIINGSNRYEVAKQLNHPKEWIPVLEKFKNLKLNFAHFGGNRAWNSFHKKGEDERIKLIIQLMNDYNNVYADFSYNIIDHNTYSIFKTIIDFNDRVLNRSLFGSDFWVVCSGGNLNLKQQQFLKKIRNNIKYLTHINGKRFLFE